MGFVEAAANFTHVSGVLVAYAILGVLVASAFLLGLIYLSSIVGREVWRRLRRIYHISVMKYWLERLETEGTHVFKKAEQEAKEAKNVP